VRWTGDRGAVLISPARISQLTRRSVEPVARTGSAFV
jgi:hypothetical protein